MQQLFPQNAKQIHYWWEANEPVCYDNHQVYFVDICNTRYSEK